MIAVFVLISRVCINSDKKSVFWLFSDYVLTLKCCLIILVDYLVRKLMAELPLCMQQRRRLGGRKNFKVLNWNTLAKFSALVLGIRIAASAPLSSSPHSHPHHGSSVKRP